MAVLLASIGRCAAVGRLPLEPSRSARSVRTWRRRLLKYLLPFSTWGVFTWAGTASDRWALALHASTHDVGLYAVLYQLGYFPCVLLGDAIQQFLGPVLFGRIGDGADPQRLAHALGWHRSMFWPVVLLFACGWLVAWKFAGPIVGLLAAPDYRAYASGLPLLVAAGALFSLGQILALAIIGTCGSAALLPAKIGCAVLAVVANFAAVRWAGPEGLLLAMPATAACYLAVTAWQCHRIQLRWNKACATSTGESQTRLQRAA
jgi:O-antigen/teichoic acid export membrane protein